MPPCWPQAPCCSSCSPVLSRIWYGRLAGAGGLGQRRDGWAFAAGLAFTLAVSLVLWRQYPLHDLGRGWVRLVQANVLANAGAALAWLASSRRLYEGTRPGILLRLQ